MKTGPIASTVNFVTGMVGAIVEDVAARPCPATVISLGAVHREVGPVQDRDPFQPSMGAPTVHRGLSYRAVDRVSAPLIVTVLVTRWIADGGIGDLVQVLPW